ncbi:cob(I)yrinic acid a,c-diamide adenosyltransferase [Magnetovibrio blakemorei]|uniref:Corrinoid adenosyltransferase n=1 Tax=Magnetovibrio blakemorei TaxID=28181 RepID=A0A1E5QC65_9PROT|nr:cob(I)yrinic acid a,c-diamide adenosyltransferase [Magnetovibrio blakemorei]OEJ69647.1 ATP:cob(I)alamin adenosyltransferase [Magnetovibrio blakemorei]
MVKLTKIYTRGGDGGDSGLVDGSRLSKSHTRFAAIGDVDEANATIGFARAVATVGSATDRFLAGIQNDLFDLGADLATPGEIPGALRLSEGRAESLEAEIDALTEQLGPLTSFVLPGGREVAARLHMARTQVRRAERTVINLNLSSPLNPEILKYLNRLSDLLFQMARAENDMGRADVLWKPGGNA